MNYAMIVDVSRCSICFACQVACKDEFVGNKYPQYSYPQPDVEQEWIRVEEIEKGKFPYVKVYPVPVLCMHCEKAPCLAACPVSGSIYRNKQGVVIIDPARCSPVKCKTKPCLKACPYQLIFFSSDLNIAQKCTLCQHRLDQGEMPACITACPSNVFLFGAESKVLKEVKRRGAKQLHPEYKTQPRIYYLGLPSVTLAGHIVDSRSFMDVMGAAVTVKGGSQSETRSTKSDISGNFAIEDLKLSGSYTVTIEHRGYRPLTIEKVVVDNDYQHLGDLKLSKASKK